MTFIFKIQLKSLNTPMVWRRILVPIHFSFYDFHRVIQTAFGWEGRHRFEFCDRERDAAISVGIADPDYEEFNIKDSKSIKITDIFSFPGDKLKYIYDFSEEWVHLIKLETIIMDRFFNADCLGGEGACPPEDCEGVNGYKKIKKILLNPKNPEYEFIRKWLGLKNDEDWDPNLFNLEEASKAVRRV